MSCLWKLVILNNAFETKYSNLQFSCNLYIPIIAINETCKSRSKVSGPCKCLNILNIISKIPLISCFYCWYNVFCPILKFRFLGDWQGSKMSLSIASSLHLLPLSPICAAPVFPHHSLLCLDRVLETSCAPPSTLGTSGPGTLVPQRTTCQRAVYGGQEPRSPGRVSSW